VGTDSSVEAYFLATMMASVANHFSSSAESEESFLSDDAWGALRFAYRPVPGSEILFDFAQTSSKSGFVDGALTAWGNHGRSIKSVAVDPVVDLPFAIKDEAVAASEGDILGVGENHLRGTLDAVGTLGVMSGAKTALTNVLEARLAASGVAGPGGRIAAYPPGSFTVGAYDDIRGTVPGLDAHHVGQKAVMQKLVLDYNPGTAPAILVPRLGHTVGGGKGVVSRAVNGLTTVRDLIARDIREIRRMYPGVPASQLQELIRMNKKMYQSANR
jgi:hypothetical protein